MKKLLFAAFAVGALAAGSAGAADLPAKARPLPPPPPPCAQFGGFYVGGSVGWGYNEHHWRDLDGWTNNNTLGFLPHEVTSTENGFIGGIQGGYNWQTRCTLFGIEADFSWADIDHDVFHRAFPGPGVETLAVSSSLQGFGTVRARTGVIVDNLLLYVTGGIAYANFERSATVVSPLFGVNETFTSDDKTRWGWTLGFGTEWQFAPNWSFKSEVLYALFEKDEKTFTCLAFCGPAGLPVRLEHQDSVWVSRIGINYRFGGGTTY
jgi:outer membrane immunogenic protein